MGGGGEKKRGIDGLDGMGGGFLGQLDTWGKEAGRFFKTAADGAGKALKGAGDEVGKLFSDAFGPEKGPGKVELPPELKPPKGGVDLSDAEIVRRALRERRPTGRGLESTFLTGQGATGAAPTTPKTKVGQ